MQNNFHELKYLKHSEIDSEKWNGCIDGAQNCRVYAYDWHLDRTAIEWDALVLADYQFVMPLPIRKKWNIKYLYQPLFSQQLGIFPKPPVNIANLFYSELLKRFRYSDFQINSENSVMVNSNDLLFAPRVNYLLDLQNEYTILTNSFSKNTKRNLVKAKKNNLQLIRGIRLEEYLNFKKNNLPVKLREKDFNNLKSIIAYGQYKGFGEIYGVYSSNNKLCAAVYFCHWKDRIINMNAASSELGKELLAMYFLIDSLIKKYAGNNIKLDFEGSMIPGVARFYSGFGAYVETYFQLKFNHLPLPLRWLKR